MILNSSKNSQEVDRQLIMLKDRFEYYLNPNHCKRIDNKIINPKFAKRMLKAR